MNMGPGGTYWILGNGEITEAGMMQMPPDAEASTHWLYHVNVANVDESAGRARSLGAKLLVEPRDIPNMGRFQVAEDPVGATFAIYESAQR